MLTATTSSPYPFFKQHLINFKHDETRMQQGINRDSSQQRNRDLGLNEVAKIEALDSPSRYQTTIMEDSSTDGRSSRGQNYIKLERYDAAEEAVIVAHEIPPNILMSGESASRGISDCMEQRFNLGYSRDYWNTSEKSLCGASVSCSSVEENDEARHSQGAQPMSPSPGDEDFEFLRNLLQEAEPSPAAAPFPNGRGITSFPGVTERLSSPSVAVQNHSPTFSPHPGTVSAGEGSTIQVPRVGSGNFVAGNTAALLELVEESTLHAADEVAACIWLAGDRFQAILFTRVTNTWAIEEAKIPAIAAIGRKFSEVVAGRLEAIRLAVEAEMRVADEVATARGEMALVEPDWHGSNILRRDVFTRLEAFRIYNIREAPAREPGFSLAESHLDLVRRLRGTREAVIDRINSNYKAAATAAGVHDLQFLPAVGDDEALMGIDYVAQCVLQKLKATFIAAEEVRQPTGCAPVGNIGKRLLEKQKALQTAAAKEMFKGHVRSESDSSTGITSADSSVGAATSARMFPIGARPNPKKKRRPGSRGRRCKNKECSLHPHFGITHPEYCSRHKLPGMFNVKGRRCIDPGCSRTPVYGKKGDPHPTYCAAHKLDNMIDIKNPTCREQSCNRQPSFGSPHDRRATYCASHMLEGMVNVRRMLAAKGLSRHSRRERSSAADAEASIAKPSASRRGEAPAGIRGARGEK